MSKVLLRAEGIDGQVELMSDRVVIHRAGIFNAFKYGLNAKREIPLGAISEVVFKPAAIQFGELEFIRSGRSGDERKNRAGAVRFNRKKNKEFEYFKEKTFELLAKYNQQKNNN